MTWQLLRMSGDAVAFTSDSANLSIADNLDLRIRLSLDEWTAARDETFIAKRQGGDEYIFRKDTATGRLQFVWWDTGGTPNSETADADTPLSGMGWIRVRRAGTSVLFYTSTTDTDDHASASFTQLGTTQTTPSGSIRTTVATHVTIGAAGLGRNSPLYGYVRTAAILDNTTVRADPRFYLDTEWTVGEDSGDTASDGVNTWQLGGNAEIVGPNVQGAHVSLEAAFGNNPWDSSLIWTDITEDMRLADTSRGRSYELDRFDAGTMTTELDNVDGDYHSHNTASPYYPNVKPMVPIRLRAVHDGTVYPIWQGFVDRWPITYPENIDSVASVESVDLMKPLALADVLTAGRTFLVESLAPVAWWRFSGGGTDDSSVAGTHDLTFTGSPTTGVVGAWPGDEAVRFDGTDDRASIASEGDIELLNVDRSYEFWFQIDENPTDHGVLLEISSPTSGHTPLRARYVHPGNFSFGSSGTIPISDGEWHHAVCVDDVTADTRTCYLDGNEYASVSLLSDPAENFDVRIGATTGVASQFFKGDISEIAVYDVALTAEQVTQLFLASYEGFADQRTDERIALILENAELGVGSEILTTDLREGQTVMSGVNSPSDVSALEAIQTAAETERGEFFISAAGVPTFHDRHYRAFEQVTPVAAIDQTDYVTLDLYGKDDRFILNQIVVSPSDDAEPAVAADAESIAEYGRRTHQVTIYPADENEALDHAHYLLDRYAFPLDRIASIRWEILEGVTPVDIVLGGEIGNRYTVTAPLAGDDLSVDVFLERITHNISGYDQRWFVTWEVSPAAANEEFWLLGVAGFSELGETTRLGY